MKRRRQIQILQQCERPPREPLRFDHKVKAVIVPNIKDFIVSFLIGRVKAPQCGNVDARADVNSREVHWAYCDNIRLSRAGLKGSEAAVDHNFASLPERKRHPSERRDAAGGDEGLLEVTHIVKIRHLLGADPRQNRHINLKLVLHTRSERLNVLFERLCCELSDARRDIFANLQPIRPRAAGVAARLQRVRADLLKIAAGDHRRGRQSAGGAARELNLAIGADASVLKGFADAKVVHLEPTRRAETERVAEVCF